MSHLSTIINRVKRSEEKYKNDRETMLRDILFHQHIANLYEYQESWQDQTAEEVKEANELFDKYYPMVKDTPRLKDVKEKILTPDYHSSNESLMDEFLELL